MVCLYALCFNPLKKINKITKTDVSQVRHQMKDLPIGTKIDKIEIKGP